MWSEAEYSIRGHVVDAASGRPLPGLHIRAYDRDLLWDDCLGTDDTDARGEFRICFFPHDFKEPLEGKPEIYIVVYGPDLNQLHFTEPLRPSEQAVRIEIPIRPLPVRARRATMPPFRHTIVPVTG